MVEARYHVDCRTKCFSNPAASGNVNETDIFLYDLVKLITSDRSKIWNSVGFHEAYRSLEGSQLSLRCVVQYLSDNLSPYLLFLSSPGIASIIVFRGKSASILSIVDDDNSENCQRSIFISIKADQE